MGPNEAPRPPLLFGPGRFATNGVGWLVAFVASSKGIFCKEGIIKGALWA